MLVCGGNRATVTYRARRWKWTRTCTGGVASGRGGWQYSAVFVSYGHFVLLFVFAGRHASGPSTHSGNVWTDLTACVANVTCLGQTGYVCDLEVLSSDLIPCRRGAPYTCHSVGITDLSRVCSQSSCSLFQDDFTVTVTLPHSLHPLKPCGCATNVRQSSSSRDTVQGCHSS